MDDANAQVEIDELRRRLEEAEETLRAIRSGAVDAFVVEAPQGERIYTLESADRPYRLLVEQMQQSAITLNANGTIAYCNRRFAEMLMLPHEQLFGSILRNYVQPADVSQYDRLLQEGLHGRGDAEISLNTANDQTVPVLITMNALPEDSGATLGVLITDLTRQRHQEKLSAALEALRDADRRKNEFLAILAHELRNPLAPIRNAMEIMRLTKGLDETTQAASAMMERQVGQMVRLIDDLLDVSRITRGKIELRKGMVELASVVNHALEATRAPCETGGLTLTATIPPEPLYVVGDPARLAQVVGNLLNNACKFTDHGGHVSLTVVREDSEAVLSVRDSGIGIAPDQLASIFEMFKQVDTSLERSGGLGIGLTLVKKIVELHGGSIEAQSDGIDRGSEFIVRLPLAPAPEMVEAPASLPPDKANAARPLRILVVDDNRDSAKSLLLLLRTAGHEVYAAYDGIEAVEAAARCQPNVMLLDIGLPKLNGLEAAKRIRQEPWGQGIVIVALTGWGQAEDRNRTAAAGINRHMVKPVDYPSLIQLLAEIQPLPA